MILTTYPTRYRSFPSPLVRSSDRSFGRSFDRTFAQLAALSTPRRFGPSVTGSWADDSYQLTVDLPGVPTDAVSVSVAGRTLTLDVTTGESNWSQQVRLAQTLDPEQVTARYVNGRLTVTVGKAAQPAAPEARRIAVDTTPAQSELAAPAEVGDGTNVTE